MKLFCVLLKKSHTLMVLSVTTLNYSRGQCKPVLQELLLTEVLWEVSQDEPLFYFTILTGMIDSFLFLSSFCSKWQHQGRNHHKQIISANLRAFDQTDKSVWPGHHSYSQSPTHRQPQYPGTVAPVHQQAPLHWPH